jgi:hypothetical protein
MKKSKKISVFLLIAIIFMSLNVTLQSCQAVSAPDQTTALYQSFLTDVLGVDLTEYNITSSGYGTSYPSSLGGKIKEETISYTLDSGQGKLSTWCLIENGVITTCSMDNIGGQTVFAHSNNLKDSLNDFVQKYQAFVRQYYKEDDSYLSQAISIVNNVDFQSITEKTVGDMTLRIRPITDSVTSIEWAYHQEGVDLVKKHIQLEFVNGSISWLGDTWNLYSVYDQKTISKEEAQSIGFKEAQAKPINMFSTKDSQPTAVQVTPDWNGWTSTANLNLIPGATSSQAIGLSNDTSSSVHGDPLTLYPQWHLIFYFGKPIGNVLGVEVGVWADTGEVAYSNVYGHLGGSITTVPEQTNTTQIGSSETSGDNSQSSDQTTNIYLPTQPPYLAATIISAIIAVAVVSLVIVRKKNGNKQ